MSKLVGAMQRMELVVSYILDTEREDFNENPDRNHVYFHAITLELGEKYAEVLYLEAMEGQS